MVLLIAFAIALLPLRFGHAVGVDAHTSAEEPNSSQLHKHGHDLDEPKHASGSYNDYLPGESFVDDCCGDQCSGAQILVTSAFNLHITPSHSYDLAWSQWLPEQIASAKYRPPIKFSYI